jgi:hypothetical protein
MVLPWGWRWLFLLLLLVDAAVEEERLCREFPYFSARHEEEEEEEEGSLS